MIGDTPLVFQDWADGVLAFNPATTQCRFSKSPKKQTPPSTFFALYVQLEVRLKGAKYSIGGGSWYRKQSYYQKICYCPFWKYSKPKPPVIMKNSTTKKITTITTKFLNFIEVYMPKNDHLNTRNHFSIRAIDWIENRFGTSGFATLLLKKVYFLYITPFNWKKR